MADGRTGWEAHNAFPVVYDTAVFDYLTQVRGDDFMFFARAGYAGIQAVAQVIWSGDPAASFDDEKGLPAQVRAGINAGLSGVPFWGSDISGYSCLNDPPPDKEVYLRWAAFGALSSDMHDENACAKPRFTEVVENELLAGHQDVQGIPGTTGTERLNLRLEFHAEPGGKTRLELRQGTFREPLGDGALEGWESSFTRLDSLLRRSV